MPTSEELVATAARRVAKLLQTDPEVQQCIHEVALREMQHLYTDDGRFFASDGPRVWDLDIAAADMHPSENHFYCVQHEALLKAIQLALVGLRHFSNDEPEEDN